MAAVAVPCSTTLQNLRETARPPASPSPRAMLRMRASRSLALSSVFARGMAISVGDAFPKGVQVQVKFTENLPIESLTSKGNVLMVSLPGAFTPT